jgi:hypothetical protein
MKKILLILALLSTPSLYAAQLLIVVSDITKTLCVNAQENVLKKVFNKEDVPPWNNNDSRVFLLERITKDMEYLIPAWAPIITRTVNYAINIATAKDKEVFNRNIIPLSMVCVDSLKKIQDTTKKPSSI